MKSNIGILIVTYNRLDCLKKVLDLYDQGVEMPDYILVVNNGSEKDTYDYLEQWNSKPAQYLKFCVHIKTNNGSAEGFYVGINECMKRDAEWIFVADDDAFPTVNMIKNLKMEVLRHQNENLSAICAKVINFNKIDVSHRRRNRITPFTVKSIPVAEAEYKKEYFELDQFSYVGSAISKKALSKAGSTRNDLYVFYDDTEHSLRLRQYGKIICCPSVSIVHDKDAKAKGRVNWQTYYYIRNKGYMIKEYFGNKYFWLYKMDIYLKNVPRVIARIKGYTAKERQAYIDALNDLSHDVRGKNPVYTPSWDKRI